jgi:fatty-acid peroxygenase
MSTLTKIPCEKTIDSSLCLLLEGYPFIQNRCRKYESDIFQARLFGKKVVCFTGEEAAEIFYNDYLFKRKGAAPKRVQRTLLGQQGVQGLDGKMHQSRKKMFLSIMTPENLKTLIHYTRFQWEYNSIRWNNSNIILFDEAQILLCQVACKWAGVPLDHYEIEQRAFDLGKMIDGFGAVGPRYWEGCSARKRSEEWISSIIVQIRTGKIKPPKDSAAYIIAWHRNQNSKLLNPQVAAVELLNIVRPIVAIATYITFGALAMFKHPECRAKLQLRDPNYNEMFVQEVRRLYPFTPFVGALAKKDFLWEQYLFHKDTLVLLDIYGMNHDSRIWLHPYEFNPERFFDWEHSPYLFMPQGGGNELGHRCAGEMVTLEVMKASLDFIANHLSYKVPVQDLKYPLSRIPTLPKSRFIMSHVKRKVN